MPPVTARGHQTHRRLLGAAEHVFATQGYFRAAIGDITREAGVSQGTFYIYFASKLDAFREVVQNLGHEFRTATRHAYVTATDRFNAELAGFRGFFRFAVEHPNAYRILRQAENVDLDSYRAYYERIADGYQRLLAEAIAQGEYVSYRNPEALAYMLMGLGDFLGQRWILWGNGEIPGDVFDDLTLFLRRALVTGGDWLEPQRAASEASGPTHRKDGRRPALGGAEKKETADQRRDG